MVSILLCALCVSSLGPYRHNLIFLCIVSTFCCIAVLLSVFCLSSEIYNVVDNVPASRQEVLAFAASLLEAKGEGNAVSETYLESDSKMKPKESDDANHRKLLREEHTTVVASLPEKRVRNFKIWKELLVNLKFPSYKEGLAAIASGSKDPFE